MHPTPCLLAAEPRSGTTFINSVLSRHPEIHTTGEILPGLKEGQFHHYWRERIDQEPEDLLLERLPGILSDYLDLRLEQARDARAVMVDAKYYQLEWLPKSLEVFRRKNFRVLHVIRKNLLKRHISWTLAQRRTRRRLKRPAHSTTQVSLVRIQLDTGRDLLAVLDRMDFEVKHYRRLLNTMFEVLELNYEGLVDHRRNTIRDRHMQRIYDFLDIENRDVDLSSPLRKINPNLLRHVCSNYADLVRTVSGTRWDRLLDFPEFDQKNVAGHEFLDSAWLHLQKNETEKAMLAALQAREAGPAMADPLFLMGLLNLVLGRRDKGIDQIGRALEAAKQDRNILVFYRILLEGSGLSEQTVSPALKQIDDALQAKAS